MNEEKIEELVDLIYEITDLLPKVYNMLNTLNKEFVTDKQYDDSDDLIWELPRISKVSKHGFYIEYAITNINDGKVTAKGIGEDYGDVITLNVTDLNYEEAIVLLKHFN